jgi:SpoVK/Ycf46/Vps4 family AAA+-type ATPase
VIAPEAREAGAAVTPAALVGLCREAGMEALREDREATQVARRHFVGAAKRMWRPEQEEE